MQTHEAIVLRVRQGLETQSYVRLFCEGMGLVDAAVYQLHKSRRRFPSGLSPAMWGLAELDRKGARHTLARLDVHAQHAGLGQDPMAFAAAVYACELSDALLVPDTGLMPAFLTLRAVLEGLAKGEFPGGWLRLLEVALLELQGWMSVPGQCFDCSRLDALAFDFRTERWHCQAHASPDLAPMQPQTLEILRAMYQTWRSGDVRTHDASSYPSHSPTARSQARAWCWHAVDRQLSHPLKSRAVLSELAGMAIARPK